MGCCASFQKSFLDTQLGKEKAADRKTKKLLLLGAGESGKSTFFKQITLCYMDGFDDEYRRRFRTAITAHIVHCIKALCKNCATFGKEVSEELIPLKEEVLSWKLDNTIDSKAASIVSRLWKDPGIQLAFRNRCNFQIYDNADWYFDRLTEFSNPDFLPTDDYILRARVRTTGIVDAEFSIQNFKFRLLDVGGQRNERRKWIHCFEHVTAVIFVAALNAYDLKLYEDSNVNRIVEATRLFHEVMVSPWFADSAQLLFLNKIDLFTTKIQEEPLQKYFPEYKGPENQVEPAVKFLQDLFLVNESKAKSKVFVHYTCATDTQGTQKLFISVKEFITRGALAELGFGSLPDRSSQRKLS